MKLSLKIGVFFASAILGCTSYATAGNPFDEMVNNFKRIAADGGKEGGTVQARLPNDAGGPLKNEMESQNGSVPPDEIMRQLASQVTVSYCSEAFLRKSIDQAANKFRMGQYGMAAAAALIQAQTAAACSFKDHGMPASQARDTAGQLLAMAAISNHKAGLDAPETAIQAQYAITLLRLNAVENQNLISQVEQSGVLPARAAVSVKSSSVAMTAVEMATKYSSNKLAFAREYNGRTLQTTGKIQSIGGSEKRALVVLEGIHRKNPDDQGWSDVIKCNITDENSLDDVMKISKGQNVSIKGVFRQEKFEMGVSLNDCQIVH